MASSSASEPVKKVQLEGKVIAITGANRGKREEKEDGEEEKKKEKEKPIPIQHIVPCIQISNRK
jgi:hypothetical protein